MIINISNLSNKHNIILNKISNEIKDDFNHLTEEIYNSSDKSIDWIVNSTLSRSPNLSNIFINICYLELIKHLLEEQNDIKTFIVPNRAIKKILNNYFSINQLPIKVKVEPKFFYRNLFIDKIKSIYSLFDTIHQFCLLWLVRDKKRAININSDQNITLIDIFFIPSMFHEGKYNDRYYNGILYYLSYEEKKNIFFVPHFLKKKGLKKIIKIAESADENFIYKSDFLKISDYIYALLSPLRIKKVDFNQFTFRGLNIGLILKADFKSNIINISSLFGILNYLFIKRLKENHIKLRLFLNWFENQVIDRGFNKGVKEFYPGVYRKGYQGFIVSTDYNFYLQPTKYEVNSGAISDEIVVVGKGLIKKTKKFNNDLKVTVGPAFRFSEVWDKIDRKPVTKNKIITVALPISISESYEILALIRETVKKAKLRNITFNIKPHPALNLQKLKKKLVDNWLENFELVHGEYMDNLVMSSLVIGNASSTCMETLALGIPVIIIGRKSGLSQNPIPKNVNNELWKLCYTPEELSSAINHFLNLSKKKKSKFKTIGDKVKEEYFEPVNRNGIRKLLMIK